MYSDYVDDIFYVNRSRHPNGDSFQTIRSVREDSG